MSNLPSIPKTNVSTSKLLSLKDNIPEELLKEYNARKKDLKVTEALILSHLEKNAAESKLGTNNRISLTKINGGPYAKFDFLLQIEGYVQKADQRVRIDYTTLNLLLNNKILSPTEKKRLLKLQGILPESILDENQATRAKPNENN